MYSNSDGNVFQYQLISNIDDLRQRMSHLESQERPAMSTDTWANRPANPIAYERHFATDRGIEYFWNGSLWLSITKFPLLLESFGSSGGNGYLYQATTGGAFHAGNAEDTYNVYIEKLVANHKIVSGTYNSSNLWTWDLYRFDNTGGANLINSLTSWQTGRVTGTNYTNVLTVNAQYTFSQAAWFYINLTKVATPGDIWAYPPTIWYRLVG